MQTLLDAHPNNPKIQELKNIVNFMNEEDHSGSWPALNKYIHSLDKMRGTDFKEDFASLYEIWKKYEV